MIWKNDKTGELYHGGAFMAPDGRLICNPSIAILSYYGYSEYVHNDRFSEPIPDISKKRLRAEAYRQSVDPITCEIQRLRDMGGTEEEIAEAVARREAAVAAVKAQYPYPEA